MPGAGQCQAVLPTYSVLRFGGGALTAVHRRIKSWAALPSPPKRGIQWPCERASCMQEYGRRASGMRPRTVRISRHAYGKLIEGDCTGRPSAVRSQPSRFLRIAPPILGFCHGFCSGFKCTRPWRRMCTGIVDQSRVRAEWQWGTLAQDAGAQA
jgi:hypothetical protein